MKANPGLKLLVQLTINQAIIDKMHVAMTHFSTQFTFPGRMKG